MSSEKVLVIAGRGYFGQPLIDDLLRKTDCELTVSGRNRRLAGLVNGEILS